MLFSVGESAFWQKRSAPLNSADIALSDDTKISIFQIWRIARFASKLFICISKWSIFEEHVHEQNSNLEFVYILRTCVSTVSELQSKSVRTCDSLCAKMTVGVGNQVSD